MSKNLNNTILKTKDATISIGSTIYKKEDIIKLLEATITTETFEECQEKIKTLNSGLEESEQRYDNSIIEYNKLSSAFEETHDKLKIKEREVFRLQEDNNLFKKIIEKLLRHC